MEFDIKHRIGTCPQCQETKKVIAEGYWDGYCDLCVHLHTTEVRMIE